MRRSILALTGLTVLGSVTAVGASAAAAASARPARTATLVAQSTTYAPTGLALRAGGSDVITVRNRDGIEHNLTVPGLKVDKDVKGGKVVRVTIRGAKPGTYPFHCEYHPTTMTGTITVS